MVDQRDLCIALERAGANPAVRTVVMTGNGRAFSAGADRSLVELGLVPEAGSSVLLPARARFDETMWALLSSEWIEAEAARRMGLVWRVVPDGSLLDESSGVAAAISALDPEAVVATKRLLTAGRADAARLATDRELAEMGRLVGRRDGQARTEILDQG